MRCVALSPLTTEPGRLQEIFGGNAVSDEYAIGRHVANLFVTQTYEGQSDIHSTLRPGAGPFLGPSVQWGA